MLLSLSACSGGGENQSKNIFYLGSGPEWTNECELYARTYKAVGRELAVERDKSENAKAWLKKHSMDDEDHLLGLQGSYGARESKDEVSADRFLTYNETEKMPVFDFTEIGTLDALRVAQAVKKVWDKEDIPLWGAVVSDDDTGLAMLEFFETFDCDSIQLKLPKFYASSSLEDSVGQIKGLTSLVVQDTTLESDLDESMGSCDDLTELTCLAENSMEFNGAFFPKVKKLTLIANSPSDVPDEDFVSQLKDTKVSEVNFYDPKGNDVESSLQSVEFFEQLMELDNIKKINGTKKGKFDIPMSDEIKNKREEMKKAEEAEALLEEVKEKLEDCEGDESKDEEGTPALGDKLIVRVDDEYSLESALNGEDFEGIPADRLAKSYEEADTYLSVYPSSELVGHYGNGALAYKTYTMVITFDLKNGNQRAAKCIGTEDPPQTITVYNNIPVLARSGDFLKDEAMEYVMSLL